MMNTSSDELGQISFDDHYTPEERAQIGQGLLSFNNFHTHNRLFKPDRSVDFILRDQSGHPLGGIFCEIYLHCMQIDAFWVDDRLQGLGFGQKLIRKAEQKARDLGCTFAHTTTYNFQAPQFYQSEGYEIFAELDGFPDGIIMYFLKKPLS